MDVWTRAYFKKAFEVPGAAFVLDDRPATWCSTVGTAEFEAEGTKQVRVQRIYQPMTPAGQMNVNLEKLGTILDGLNAQYLTPEGGINYKVLSDTLKNEGGEPNHTMSAYIAKCKGYPWSDNHVTLLFNMLRYVFLARFASVRGGNLNVRLGMFAQGVVNIDMDRYWPADYPAECAWTSWPTQPPAAEAPTAQRGHDYVAVNHTATTYVDDGASALDLRGLSRDATFFVLAMLNKWTRHSRYRVDATVKKLTDAVFYRGYDVSARYKLWAEREAVEPLFDWRAAWDALRQYVNQNRLYAHFSIAQYAVVTMMYQYLPDTPEAVAWLDHCWDITLPEFASIRGRFPFFNTEEGAFLSQRPLNEWAYIGNQLERVNLTALLFGQALYAGIAIRGIRRCFEIDPQDIKATEDQFQNPQYFVSAAVSEFTRRDTPNSGMIGVTFTLGDRPDHPKDGRAIPTTTVYSQNPPDTVHRWVEATTNLAVTEATEVDPAGYPPDYPRRAEILERLRLLKIAAEAIRAASPQAELDPEMALALRDRVAGSRVRTPATRVWAIEVKILPMPGYPVFLCPTQAFPYGTPYDEAGVIDKSMGDMYPNGVFVKPQEAWRIASALNWAGNSVQAVARNPTVDARAFIKGRFSEQIWPILFTPEDCHGTVRVWNQDMEADDALCLPIVVNKSLGDTAVTYKFSRRSHAVSQAVRVRETKINDVGTCVVFSTAKITTQVQMSENARNARGWIERTATDFRIVQDATVGVVPPRGPERDAPVVNENVVDGGNNA